jgi:hypothetical protein
MHLILVFFFALASLGRAENLEATNCFYRKKGLVWNIGKLTATEDYLVDGERQQVKFNVWKTVANGWGETAYAVLEKSADCRSLTDAKNNPKVTILEDDGLSLNYEYTGDNNCIDDATKKHSFELNIICSENEVSPKIISNPEDPWKVTVEFSHPKGWPAFKANALWRFFTSYRYYLSFTVVLVGAFFLVLGGYFKKTSVFLIVFASVVCFLWGICFGLILSYKAPEWVGWIVLPAASIIGVVIAFFTSKLSKVGVVLIGIWGGWSIGASLYQTVGYLVTSEVWMLWTLMLVCSLILVSMTLKFYMLVIVIGTSVIGAFMLMRGISFYAGGYPNEFTIHNEIISGGYKHVPYTVYIYALCMIVLSIMSFLWKQKGLKLLQKSRDHSGYFDING